MNQDHDFYYVPTLRILKAKRASDKLKTEKRKEPNDEEVELNDESQSNASEKKEKEGLGKANFVEFRSFWHVFKSFDRMWTFLILLLQAMIIMACHDLESPLQMFDTPILEDVMNIFITSQAILDIVFTWKTRSTID